MKILMYSFGLAHPALLSVSKLEYIHNTKYYTEIKGMCWYLLDPVEADLDSFQFLTITNKAAMIICV